MRLAALLSLAKLVPPAQNMSLYRGLKFDRWYEIK